MLQYFCTGQRCKLQLPAVWEVYTGGRKPYGPLSKLQIMCGVVEGLRPDFPPNIPAWYSALASTCWAKSPRQR